jgi:hypothetical protein
MEVHCTRARGGGKLKVESWNLKEKKKTQREAAEPVVGKIAMKY